MARIKLVLSDALVDGMDVKFKAPCNCTEIEGLTVQYPMEDDSSGTKEFSFRDAHGNDLTGIGNLFSKDAYVKVILDTVNGYAYLQNADNNSYLHSAVLGTYTHSSAGLIGSGENGKFKATSSGSYSSIAVNGSECAVRSGAESSIDLIEGCWYTFILDGTTVNFNAGGAGAGLNFKVIGGTTEPVSPSENTIWVNTDVTVSDWLFTAVEPETPVEGMIWFTVALESTVSFNALKKNGIILYPVSASQYVGGAWVDKVVKSYQEGAWIDWWIPGTLYDGGRDDEKTTGGWTSYSYVVDSGYSGITSSVTMGESSMTMAMSPTATMRSSFISTGDPVDLSEYTTAHFEFLNASGAGWAVVAVYNTSGTKLKTSDQFWKASGSVVESVDLDISDIEGEARVGVLIWSNSKNVTISVEMALARLL